MAWINSFLIFHFLLALVFSEEVHWTQKRNFHRFKSILSDRLEKLASLSNNRAFDAELNPMLLSRVPGTKGHERVEKFIKDRLSDLNWDIQEDNFTATTPLGEKPFSNIIATQNPHAQRRLILACHYDSKYFPNFEFIGATDSAVPCAMMLDLARSMDKYLKKKAKDSKNGIPEVSLQFIFFDGEEAFHEWTDADSLYGARHLAKKFEERPYPEKNNENTNLLHTIDVLILLDLIGGQRPQFRNFFLNTEKLFERFAKIEKKLRNKNLLDSHFKYFMEDKVYESNAGMIQDDHIPFLKKDVPIVHLISYPFPPQWHRQEDTKHYLDWTSISDLNKILRTFVAEYLNLDIDGKRKN